MFLIDTVTLSELAQATARSGGRRRGSNGSERPTFSSASSALAKSSAALRDSARPTRALPTRLRPGWTGYLALYGERVLPFELRTARRWGALSAALAQ